MNEEKKIVENAITELENKLDTTDCVEDLKFTSRDILLKRDIDFINKIKLNKEYQERTKTWKDYTREEQADLIMRYVEDNSAIVRVFPLEYYYKLDPDNKMETYKFGIIYINEEDKFQMQEIDTAFDYIPDESNDSIIYTRDNTPISVGVKPVSFNEENS